MELLEKAPIDLHRGGEGRRLWGWLLQRYAIDEILAVKPLAAELCRIADRLAEVRAALKKDGLSTAGKKNPLVDVEVKLSGQLSKLWKTLGLADRTDEQRRPVGRPTDSDRRWRA